MSYIWSRKYSHPLNDLTRELKKELYTQPYDTIDFPAHRDTISHVDSYHPKSALLCTINWALVNVWNPYIRPNWLVKRAEDWAFQLIRYEDENSDYADLAPVNAPMNTVACFVREGPDAYSVKRHIERLPEFLWLKHEGMLTNGTNGVQSWDTSFMVLAMAVAGVATDPRWKPMLMKALEFLDEHQIREDCYDQALCYRQQRKGAWGFSTRDQGYTVSDCTSEAVKSVVLLQRIPGFPKLISDERLRDAIDTLLTMQNASGGFSSYEPTRGPEWLEMLNAAEVFGRIMIEYDYPECTTAVVTALSMFSTQDPVYRKADIATAISRAITYIRRAQREDGSWYGSWGICFTYAGMFALESLASVGETCANSEYARKGCAFFLGKQRADGGWGESYKSCETATWVEHENTQVVQTCWALLALMDADCPDREAIERGIRLVMRRQQADGGWEQEAIEGVFNKSW